MLLFLAGVGIVELVFFLLFFAFWIWVIIDVVKQNFKNGTTKATWLLVVVLFPFFGSIIYLIFGRR